MTLTPAMKLPRTAPTGRVRLWFWNLAGAQSLLVPRDQAPIERQRLLAEGAVVYHTELCV